VSHITKLASKEMSYIWVRLLLQSDTLLKATTFERVAREGILEAYVEAAPRLVRCAEARDRLSAYQLRVQQEHDELPPKHFPMIEPIEGEVERFLYEAKNYLRDLTGVLRAAFGATCRNASDFALTKKERHSAAERVVAEALGKGHPLTRLLAQCSGWIGEITRMRNALEHPGGHSGTLTVQNFGFGGPEPQPPSWFRNDAPATEIVGDMSAMCRLLLEFGEDLVALLVQTRLASPHLRIGEVPEDQRDADVPVRLMLILQPPVEP
jgi:hypothetical protein